MILSLFPAALVVTWAADGSSGVRRLLRRALHWRVSPAWWLIVLLGLPGLTVGLAVQFGDEVRPFDPSSLILSQLGFLVINFVAVNLWEETTWTGFFQTRLEQRHNWLVASVLTAVPFAAVHLPLQFFLDEPVTVGSLAAAFGVYLVLGLLVRPLMAVFRRGTGDSLLLVGLLHSVFNRTANQNGLSATLLDGPAHQLTLLIAVVALTAMVAVVVRSRLSRQHGAELAGLPPVPGVSPVLTGNERN